MKIVARVLVLSLIYLASGLASATTVEEAGGDVCEQRPDLCDGFRPKHPVAKKKRKVKCRQPGASYSMRENLPLCPRRSKSESAELDLPSGAFDDEGNSRSRGRRPASAEIAAPLPVSHISFESYVKANTNHPALARHPSSANQTAFVTGERSATPIPDPVVNTSGGFGSNSGGFNSGSGGFGSASSLPTTSTSGSTSGPAPASIPASGSSPGGGSAPASPLPNQ